MEKKEYQLSNPQKSILETEQYYQGTSINTICGYVYISDTVDFDMLQKAINEMVKTNDGMKLRIKTKDDSCVQYLEEYKSFEINTIALSSVKELEAKALEIANTPLMKENEPLFQFVLFKLPNGSGGFIVNVHHLIGDSWSLGLIAKEVTEIYAELLQGTYETKMFPSYLNYLEAENTYKNSDKWKKDKAYWEEVFQTVPEVASIPSMKSTNSQTPSCVGKREKFILPQEELQAIKAFCDNHQISIYNFFMAVYSLYVARVSNLDDFVMGTPILNRTGFDQKHTMGMFVSVAPLRVQLNHELSFIDFAKKVSTDIMALFRHQKYSYQSILEDLRKRDASIPNLYNVILSYQITKTVEENNQVHYKTDWVFNGNSADELQIHLFDLNDEAAMTVAYDYKAEQFDEQEIANLHARILTIIHQIMKNNDISLKDIEIVTPEEKHQILYDFNNTKVDYPRDKTIVDLFEEQVRKTPDNIAVVFEDQHLTYQELNEKANQLARYLISINIKSSDIISILLDKNISMIISILAVLKIGACYIPIDPKYPKDRIQYILNDSKSRLLITSKDINFIFDKLILVDQLSELSNFKNSNLDISIPSKTLAYIIYTSGSTGNPKGVTISHLSLMNYIYWANKFYCNNSPLNFPLYSSIAFDLTVTSIYTPIISGGAIIIYKENDIFQTLKSIFTDGISNIIKVTPAHLSLINEFDFSKTNITKIIVGGDILLPEICNSITKHFENIKIYNEYGPTEATVGCMIYEYSNISNKYQSVPIGTPIDNVKIYVLDKNLKLVPFYCSGEIYISGNCLSSGYLESSLNADKFIKNPFNDDILYKTGDIAKFCEKDIIEYIGRSDFQLKLYGFRIETGDIIKNTLKFHSIKDCFVDIYHFSKSNVLCAFYVSNNDISVEALKAFLASRLPDYMIPKIWTRIDKIPLTINGKVNKKLLPKPNFIENNTVPPRNDIDLLILKNINDILLLNINNINCNFFEIGFDSLLAIKLSIILSKQYNIEISVKDIFNYSTVKGLSDYIATLSHQAKNEMKPVPKADYYPASSAEKRIYYASSVDNNSTLYNIAGGMIVDKPLNIKQLQKCFETLIQRHEVLRTHFEIVDNEIVQVVENKLEFTLSAEEAISDDSNSIYASFVKPFDLKKAPLFRAKVVQLKNNKMLLLLDMHHIISDGTSLSILLQELCELYNGKVLPEKQVDYKDFTLWEKEQFEANEFKQAKEFWVNQYKDEIPLLNMPTTFARPSVQSFEGANYHAKLSNEVFEKINQVAKQLGITPYMLMLSAYYILLSKYSSQDDIVIGTPIVGRELPELNHMLGMFVNTLALRNKVDHSNNFHEFANAIKEYCLSAFKHQSYPFDELVKELSIKRDTSRNSLFDVMFVYQNNGYPAINFDGIHAEYFIPDSPISKFDLTLEVIPTNDEYSLRFEYCTKLFDEDFIKRLSSHYMNILTAILDNAEIKIADIDMLSEEEKHQILYDFNNTKVDYPRDKTIVDLFEEQVEKTPDNIAVVFEDQQLTYRELNEKANQIAQHLIAKNVKRNQIIGILLSRTPDMLCAMFGILKSGAGYMLIDNSLPYDRILFMLENSNSPYLITSHKMKEIDSISKIYLEDFPYENYSKQNLNSYSDNEDSFCVIYTSGSTGIPKGVELKRKGVINLLKSYQKFLNTDICQNFLSMSSIAFDMFVVECFIPLLSGNSIILTNEEEQKIPLFTNEIIEKYQINFILTTPSRMELLLSNSKGENVWKNVKIIQLGGEVFPSSLYEKIHKQAPNAHIFNGYGPTEITACCSSKEITSANDISIGKPFGNTQIFICDKNLNLCSIGVEGEICVSGYGVAKGYIHNTELTQKSFVVNPFGNGILYRTGDIAKYKENGEIDYVGRKDLQIKIRGLRVELSEIEKQFSNIPQVNHVSVIYKNETNSPYLVAFFTAKIPCNISAIRKHLSECLPLYMIPKYIIQLEELPITLNGKINKKQLENYKIDRNEINDYVEPTTETEKLFCSTWEQLLNAKIGIDTDIFEMGADSLLAIKFKTELLAHNINIAYSDIFQYKTIRELAAIHEQSQIKTLEEYNFSLCEKALQNNTVSQLSTALSHIETNNCNNILLLGANGFVGSHILYNFIKKDKGIAYCIIRDKNNKEAKARFLDVLHFYFGTELDSYFDSRIHMVKGDILKPDFGLTPEQYQSLINSTDVVVNTAAMVKHYGSKNKFKEINVDLTKKLIDLCIQNKKRFLHISSLSVSGNLSLDGDYSERAKLSTEPLNFSEQNLFIGQNLDNEYINSKFLAEKLILEAIAKQNLHAQILRLGNVTNRYSDGVFQMNYQENAFLNRIHSFIQLGILPENLVDMYIEFTPVDSCGEAIIAILENNMPDVSVYHLYDNHHVLLHQLLKVFQQENINIQTVSKEDFRLCINELLKSNSKTDLLSGIINDLGPNKELEYTSNIHILSDFTRAFLYHIGFHWPNIDEEYLKKYIEYMKKLF